MWSSKTVFCSFNYVEVLIFCINLRSIVILSKRMFDFDCPAKFKSRTELNFVEKCPKVWELDGWKIFFAVSLLFGTGRMFQTRRWMNFLYENFSFFEINRIIYQNKNIINFCFSLQKKKLNSEKKISEVLLEKKKLVHEK